MSDLLKINVNEHTEKKGQLTYLSWAWAWAEVLKVDPSATWVVHTYGPQGSEQPCMWIGETAMVHTSVTVKGLRRECMLPVMDNRNNALKNPDARKVSDAIMRCMTKAISMHGLGLYIYAGEDLPEGEEAPKEPAKPVQEFTAPIITPNSDIQVALERTSILIDTAEGIKERFAADDVVAVYELYSSIKDNDKSGGEETRYLWKQLPSHIRSAITSYGKSLKEETV